MGHQEQLRPPVKQTPFGTDVEQYIWRIESGQERTASLEFNFNPIPTDAGLGDGLGGRGMRNITNSKSKV